MLRKNWKIVFLIFLLMLYMVGCEMECYNPAGPDVPDPDIVKYFDFIVEYHRPAGSIIDPDASNLKVTWFAIIYSVSGQTEIKDIHLEKRNEDLFVGELNQVACKPGYDNSRVFDFFTPDTKRQNWSGVGRPLFFGDDFVLENKQTRIRTQLLYIIDNYHLNEGTMARCRIIHDGSVVSKPLQLANAE